jgi:ABC-2 type transport system ATP-binding protein
MSTAIHIEKVFKKLGSRDILRGISFDVAAGDIFGYLGPNGAGKTTTIRILLGLLKADAGKVEVLGQDINTTGIRLKIGFALDPDGLYDSMSAVENLEYYADIYAVAEADQSIAKVLGLVGLADRAHDRVGTYSKGMRQRLSLARSMVHNPEILILDEPTSGVDPTGQIEIRKILLNIAHSEKKTVLLSSHNLDEVQRICNRIALIDRGEIKLAGELENLRHQMGSSGVIVEYSGVLDKSVLNEMRSRPSLVCRDIGENKLFFEAGEGRAEVSEIIAFLSGQGVKIEQIARSEASLEDLYSTILKEVENK